MSSDQKTNPPISVKANENDLEMFQLYLSGKTYVEIAEHYGVTKQRVQFVAKRSNWKGKVAKFYRKAYQSVMDAGIRKTAIKAYSIVDHYVSRIEAKIKEDPEYFLSVEEIRELRQLFQVFQNENRLMDEKPTQNISQKITHELKLPPGVKHFGVDPPTGEVKNIEHTEVKVTDELTDEDTESLEDR